MRLLFSFVQKIIALVFLFSAAIILSGLFGALHDQISYTVSREYFTLFKFRQFGINPNMTERLGAAIVGVQATWWTGILIGSTLGTISLFAPDARTMVRETLRACLLVAFVTLLAGVAGMLWGWITFVLFSSPAPAGWFVPKAIQHLPAYLCAGAMHNASYVGGVIGLLIGAIRLGQRVSALRQAAGSEGTRGQKGHLRLFHES